MNNNQFRRLVLDNPGAANESLSSNKPAGGGGGGASSTLGAKKSSFIPMTPRNVKGGADAEFARQVRERNAALHPTKTFKSVAPKGSKYGAGYTDRAKARAEAGDAAGDDKAARIQALEEQMKLGQISEDTFTTLRDAIAGGDINSTHLVKGLDRKLLERVRRGEDVLGTGSTSGADGVTTPDVDEELDQLGEKAVEPVKKAVTEKKGNMAAPHQIAGAKRSRDEIMAELKAHRKAAAEAQAAPLLDNRWRKVGDGETSRIEIDRKGREVLITVDEDGVVKKKVRKVAPQDTREAPVVNDMPDAHKPVLGSDVPVPEAPKVDQVEDDDDDDIFEGAGTDYDPLGGDDDDNSNSDDESVHDQTAPTNEKSGSRQSADDAVSEREEEIGDVKPLPATRRYFKDNPEVEEESSKDRLAGVAELLKKAAKMDAATIENDDEDATDEQAVRLKKRAQMLAQNDRDLDDMDMGFGGSRYDDGEDEADSKIKLSEWKDDNNGEQSIEKNGDSKKKRRPKKRKGDGNNMADIMRVIEGRKAGAGK